MQKYYDNLDIKNDDWFLKLTPRERLRLTEEKCYEILKIRTYNKNIVIKPSWSFSDDYKKFIKVE